MGGGRSGIPIWVCTTTRDNKVAGVADLAADPSLITDPTNPVRSRGWTGRTGQTVADIYGTSNDNVLMPNYDENQLLNAPMTFDLPPNGSFEFPAVYDSPLHTTEGNDAPRYTNARLTVPAGWSGSVSVPLFTQSVGYSSTPVISVITKRTSGQWDAVPTVATWTLDTTPPVTTASQAAGYSTAEPVTLESDEPATIHYTLDGTVPTDASPVYATPVTIEPGASLAFFAMDDVGNREGIKTYAPSATGVDLRIASRSASAIVFSATASGAAAGFEYLFVMSNPAGVWTVVQPYGLSNTWTWKTTTAETGAYTLQVWTRNAGSTVAYDAVSGMGVSIDPSPVAAVTLASSVSSPQIVGAQVTFTASATGTSGSYEYQFVPEEPAGGLVDCCSAYSQPVAGPGTQRASRPERTLYKCGRGTRARRSATTRRPGWDSVSRPLRQPPSH